jgi:hypothetical protein
MWTGFVGMVRQLIGTMTLAPLYRVLQGKFTTDFIVDLSRSTGTIYGYWELDESLSPALLILLAGGAAAFLLHKPNLKAPVIKKRLIGEICLILAVWIVIEFTLAKGLIYPLLRGLPVLKSQQANVRNACAFIFPLAVVGAIIFDNWTKDWESNGRLWIAFLLLDGIALGTLWSYHYVPDHYWVGERLYTYNQCDFRPILATYDEVRYQGATFPVDKVVLEADPWAVFQDNATNLIDPYNTFFKFTNSKLTAIHAGSVYDISGGYYNIVDPTGYVFPEVNHSQEYERIPVTEKTQVLDFINRRQPDWKLPLIQQVLDWTALITLIAEFCVLLVVLARKWIRFPKHSSK